MRVRKGEPMHYFWVGVLLGALLCAILAYL